MVRVCGTRTEGTPIRDAILTLAQDVATVAARLEETRSDLHDLVKRIEGLSRRVDAVTKADEIAQAVATELRNQARRRLTFSRKLAGALIAAVMLVPALHDAWAWFG